MKNIKLLFMSAVSTALIAGTVLYPNDAMAQGRKSAQHTARVVTPEALIQKLYKVDNDGNGPIFTQEGKRYQNEFFTPSLQKLIWKNVTGLKPGEVANLDFDPLYNAQDTGITAFHIGPAQKQKNASKLIIPVTFKNYGHPNRILFRLRHLDGKWKIDDLDYGSGQTLVKRLSLVW